MDLARQGGIFGLCCWGGALQISALAKTYERPLFESCVWPIAEAMVEGEHGMGYHIVPYASSPPAVTQRQPMFCFVLFGLQLSVCMWWLQVPLRDLSDA